MKQILIGLAVASLVTARPELYKEKEDFQYSRSSSDEGTKSGYYDAQRGNMGGNYERAHNMDHLAQHQMGGLVKQVQGELGDGSKTRSGNVFTAANSQGVYGSGRYDLSSLGGRNFQDGTTYLDSQTHNTAANGAYAARSSSQNNAKYSTNSQLHNSGFRGYQLGDLQEGQNLNSFDGYQHGSQSDRNSRYYAQSGHQERNEYEQSSLNQQALNNFGADSLNRPGHVRIIVRPGARVAIPVSAQATSGSHAASYYDQNTDNSEAEVLNSNSQQAAFIPTDNAKRYESSYSYRKQWEKHDTKPVVVPLATPTVFTPKISELYDESRLHHATRYENADYNLASSQARQQADFNSQHAALSSQLRNQQEYNARQHSELSTSHAQKHSALSSDSSDYTQSGYNADANSHSANLIGSITSKPKSYQSSYSYHKSWERQGDPYVIRPVSNNELDTQTSQKLTDLSGSHQYSSHNYGSRQSHQGYSSGDCIIECDPNSHIRKARSYNSAPAQVQEQRQNINDGLETQQSQTGWQNIEDLGQQTQNNWDNLENLSQQTQNKWDNFENVGQQTQNSFDKLEDLGQQTQTFDNLQDLGQHAQNKFDNLEDLGQQTQNGWEQTQDFGQQAQDLSQQTQDFGQHTQDLSQQTQDFEQQNENQWHVGQETQSTLNNLEALGQQSESIDEQKGVTWDTQEQSGPTSPKNVEDFGQQTQKKWTQIEEPVFEKQDVFEGTQHTHSFTNKNVSIWDQIANQHQTLEIEDKQKVEHPFDGQSLNNFPEDISQQTQVLSDDLSIASSNTHDPIPKNDFPLNQQPLSQENHKKPSFLNNLWGKIDNLDGDNIAPNNKNDKDIFSDTSNLQSSNSYNAKDFDTLWLTTGGKPLDEVQGTLTPAMATTTSTTEKTLQNDRSKDIGRGDIGPENWSVDDIKTTTLRSFIEGINKKPDESDTFLTQNNKHHYLNPIENLSTTPKVSKPNKESTNIHEVIIETVPKEIDNKFVAQNEQTFQSHDQSNLSHGTQFVDLGQKSENWEQQSHGFDDETVFGNYNQNSYQHGASDQQTVLFGQETEDWAQQQHQSQIFHTSENSDQNVFFQHDIQSQNQDKQIEIESKPGESQQHPSHYFNHMVNDFHKQHHFHHQHGIDHQHEFDHQHGFDHHLDFHQQHGFHQHSTGPQHQYGFQHPQEFHFRNTGFEQNNIPSEVLEAKSDDLKPLNHHHIYQNEQEYESKDVQGTEYENKDVQGTLDGFGQQQSTQRTDQQFTGPNQPTKWEHQDTQTLLTDFSQQNQEPHFNNFEQINVEKLTELGQKKQSSEFNVFPEFKQQQSTRKTDHESIGPHQPSQWDQQDTKALFTDPTKQNQKPHFDNFEQINVEKLPDLGQKKHSSEFNVIPDFGQQQSIDQQFIGLNSPSQWEQQNPRQHQTDLSEQIQDSNFDNFDQKNVEQLPDFGQKKQSSEFDVIPINQKEQLAGKERSLNNEEIPKVTDQGNNKNKNVDLEKQILYDAPHQHTSGADTLQIKQNQLSLSASQPSKELATETSSITPTDKPGFWKSVGHKFVSAKDKVASWFGKK